MKINKRIKFVLLTITLLLVFIVILSFNRNIKIKASAFDYFDKVKIKKCSINLEYVSTAWTGKEIKPNVTVVYENEKLAEGVDYTVDYKNNISAGEARVIIRGIGNYRGVKKLKFFIEGINLEKDCQFRTKGSSVYVYYNGELVDPENYVITHTTRRVKVSETQNSNFIKKEYLVITTYKVTGCGKYYGSYYYDVSEVEYEIERIQLSL